MCSSRSESLWVEAEIRTNTAVHTSTESQCLVGGLGGGGSARSTTDSERKNAKGKKDARPVSHWLAPDKLPHDPLDRAAIGPSSPSATG